MGDYADVFLDQLFDIDAVSLDGEIDEETGQLIHNPFTRECKPTGPGLCPNCGGPTRSINGRYGMFYGCKSYPKCKGSRNY